MPATIWSKFYWADYMNDSALKLCSFAAQGLWMRMLCIASEADPIGYVSVNGIPLSASDIARIAGGDPTEVESLLGELDRNGVFSRDRNARIFSRRMFRDARRMAESRKTGKRGGNPTLLKQRDISPGVNPPDNPRDNTQEPEARSQRERKIESPHRHSPTRAPATKRFDEFWLPYPRSRNMSRTEALDQWLRLTPDDQDMAIRSVPAFVEFTRKDATYKPVHACRYLKFRRFEGFSEPEPTEPAAARTDGRVFIADDTPEWLAWQAHLKGMGKPGSPRTRSQTHGKEGWWFDSDLPPGSASARPANEAMREKRE